jgi:hypothetical protein
MVFLKSLKAGPLTALIDDCAPIVSIRGAAASILIEMGILRDASFFYYSA